MTTKPINVAVSVLADISTGIYRTPANALKELISNAFDADANKVIINTGYPNFRTITCRDDGKGMDSCEFDEIMNKIGGSSKRKSDKQFTDLGRPIIGKIGIGILAVAQICKKFTIISSKQGFATKFEADVDFSELNSEKAKLISMGTPEARNIGTYSLSDDLPEDIEKHYTKIILQDIDPGFRKRLLESGSPDNKIKGYKYRKGDPKIILEFINWLATTDVRDIPDYYRLLWELSITCPIPYFNGGPVIGEEMISFIKQSLINYKFSVEIDRINLSKIILFPNSPDICLRGIDYSVYNIDFDEIVDGRRLAFNGYIYHQRKSIHPSELRGLLIRVRNVAIGIYDKSLMNYPKPQGPRMTGISGEIYVEEGLEEALNVDRNSFRETDSHYIKLQEIVYAKLGGDQETKISGIFSDISKRSELWNQNRKKKEAIKSREIIKKNLESITHKIFNIEMSDIKNPSKPIDIDFSKGKIIINEHHTIFPRSKESRTLLEKVFIAYEYALEYGESKDTVRTEFYKCLIGGQE